MRYSLTEQSVTSMCQCGRIASVIFREWRLQDHTVFRCVKRIYHVITREPARRSFPPDVVGRAPREDIVRGPHALATA